MQKLSSSNQLKKIIATVIVGLMIIGMSVLIYFIGADTKYSSLISFFISIFLSIISWHIGASHDVKNATKKWLPMAKACVNKLLTLQLTIKQMEIRNQEICNNIINEANIECCRAYTKANCESFNDQLNDVKTHLDDSVTEWLDFINANCEDNECAEIAQIIEDKKMQQQEKAYIHLRQRKRRPHKVPDRNFG
jgi:hypothetical protein